MEQNLVRFFIIDLILFGIENFLFQIIKSLQFSSTSFYIFKVEHMYMEEASYIYILKLDYSRIIFKIKKKIEHMLPHHQCHQKHLSQSL